MRKPVIFAVLALVAAVGHAGETTKPIWRKDVTKEAIPTLPVQGMAHGVKFKIEKASIQNGILTLRQGKEFFADQEFVIFTFLKEGETLEGKKFKVKTDDGFGAPHIHFKYKVEGSRLPKSEIFSKGHTMKLEFGKASAKKISGKIYLCLPDKAKSFVAGSFEAEMK